MLFRSIDREIVGPSVRAIADEGIDFRGTLFIGLMLTPTGPSVIEYNTRFGDPETQVVLPRLETDVLALLWAALVFAQRLAWRPWYVALVALPLVWSYAAIYLLDSFLWAAAPMVAFLSVTTAWTAWAFLRYDRLVGSPAARFLVGVLGRTARGRGPGQVGAVVLVVGHPVLVGVRIGTAVEILEAVGVFLLGLAVVLDVRDAVLIAVGAEIGRAHV